MKRNISLKSGNDATISLVLCGAAGSGVQTVEQLLIKVFKAAGFHVCATKEYMSRVRGGSNSTEIRVSSGPVLAPVQRIDLAVPLDKEALAHLADRISKTTLILGEKTMIGADRSDMIDVPFSKIAEEAGNKLYANNVAVSVVAAILGVGQDVVLGVVQKFFAKKSAEIITGNCEAIKKGYAFIKPVLDSGCINPARFRVLNKDQRVIDEILASGGQAISLGALSAGCNFIASYPMSPGTAVLTFLAANAKKFNVVAEQAEDEISAINMALGASYAGARAMVTTSGGGFALMEEGVSLAGMIETPVVIHIGQRPGPATGLPTRTEQADLELALYSGHGEFPRAIFTPGDITQAFELAQQAFATADKFQTPVFILSDQHLVDLSYNCAPFEIPEAVFSSTIVKTDKDYRRYALTKTGISPRGIPGFGEGLVLVDSDEHDEWGRITESAVVRKAMMDKRLGKLAGLKKEAVAPAFFGAKNFKTLLVCWGSTLPAVHEAMESLGRRDLAMLHFGQVYPISAKALPLLEKAKRIVVIENNATAQFAKLLKLEFGVEADEKILKYNGQPFYADELAGKIADVLR